jgi:hypothetical protein
MKSLTLILTIAAFLFGAQMQSCHSSKTGAPTTPNPDKENFSITIAGKTFTGTNAAIENVESYVTARGAADVQVASEYLLNFAKAANITGKIANDLKDQTKLLPAIWALVPYLITDLPSLITAGKSLRNFQEFYIAANGLTADERAQVSGYFANKLNLPFPIAEQIAESAIEAALANMKLAGTVKGSIK